MSKKKLLKACIYILAIKLYAFILLKARINFFSNINNIKVIVN